MKKILIIHHGIGLGGGLVALIGLITDLKKCNQVSVLCIHDSSAVDYIKNAGVDVTVSDAKFYRTFYRLYVHSEADYFSLSKSIKNIKNIITFYINKYLFAKTELNKYSKDFDVLYLNSTFVSDFARAGKKLGKEVFIHIREPLAQGLFGLRKKIITNEIKHYCDEIIAISKDNAKRIGLQKKHIIYDPVVIEGRRNNEVIETNNDYKYFLYLGGAQRIKGFEQFVKSLPYLDQNIKIFFAGGVPTRTSGFLRQIFNKINEFNYPVENLTKTLSESKNIIPIGLIDNVFNYLDVSIAIIAPFSKPHAALPILEAFSQKKTIIVSDIIGMDEIVTSSNGFFFKNKYPHTLAETINKVANLPASEYEAFCNNAFSTYELLQKHNKTEMESIKLFNI